MDDLPAPVTEVVAAINVADSDRSVTTVTATWASSVFNGQSDFIFTVAGDRVAEMRIPPH